MADATAIITRSFHSEDGKDIHRRFLSMPATEHNRDLKVPLMDAKSRSFVETSFSNDAKLDSLKVPILANPTARDYARTVPFILGNEACERFAYYGLMAPLALYYKELHGKGFAGSVVQYFQMLAYFSPLLGGYVADSYLGKYKTILSFSCIYVVGLFVFAGSCFNNIEGLGFFGLALIGLGTGGIKPCVSAFGGDQFQPHEDERKEKFFQYFYFTINFGSVFSYLIIPLIRENAGYPYAFGTPAIFFAVAIIVFVIGEKTLGYNKTPAQGSVLAHVYRLSMTAFKNRKTVPKETSWVEGALTKYTRDEVEEVKSVYRILPVFLSLPVFWALFNNLGTYFVFQADKMDRHLGVWEITADQTGVVNPICVMLFIPIFEKFIYTRFPNFKHTSRMVLGMFFCVLSYGVATLLEIYISNEPENSVPYPLQIPQVLLITFAEILISISGLEFSYAQAPPSMKSSITALFLLTISVGSLLGGVLSQVLDPYASWIFYAVCTGLCVINAVAFIFVAAWFRKSDRLRNEAVAQALLKESTLN
eukprot:GILJ01001282.1.p1 GENE.GILJ01001282.1~~GILJ01001282.1.p1  ORF type:complete len:535 (-),score=85.63 GILJ01001282.1:198-1802(-)